MAEAYIIINKPVPIYDQPGAIGKIINAYPIGTEINIVDTDSGWMHTTDGYYIFQDNTNIVSVKRFKIEHEEEYNTLKKSTEKTTKSKPKFKMLLKAAGGAVTTTDAVTLKGDDIVDINTGNKVPSDLKDRVTAVTKVDGSNVTIYDPSSGNEYTVHASDLRVYDPEDGTFSDANGAATAVNNVVDKAIDFIKNNTDGSSDIPAVTDFANLGVSDLAQVYGMPYQFLPWVDNRLEDCTSFNKIGRKFGQKILSRSPILIMQAGRADFMRGYSKEEETTMWNALQGALSNAATLVSTELDHMVNLPGQYYSLKLQPNEYFAAVDQMAHAMANLLGIGNVKWELPDGDGGALSDISWKNACTRPNLGFLSGMGQFQTGSVAFYINSEPQVQESASNATTKSALDQKLNQIGRMASEIQFYLGGVSNYTGVDISGRIQEIANKSDQDVSSSGFMGIFDSIIENVQCLMVGGRMAFPEIWADSQFSRSYNVTIKLNSPDCDNLSIFINIMLPLAHILAFVLPKSIGNNNYASPFLVRAYYKSVFHVDMGIITGCQITKGDVGSWTQNGLPTQVTVNLEIKDLFTVMSLATGLVLGSKITSNPGQLDYIANMCGINIDTPDVSRTLKLWWAVNNPAGTFSRAVSGLWEGAVLSAYRRFCDILPGGGMGRGTI